MAQTTKFGVLGCGKIANDFAQALKNVPEAKIVAFGSREKENSVKYGKMFDVPEEKCYGSYDELVKDKEIDIIYVASPHSHHYEHCKLCFSHNKSVLCEKPITLSAEQLKSLIAEARSKNLFFMEALWTRFQPEIQFLQKKILPKIEPIMHVSGTIGIEHEGTSRLLEPGLGGGALMDIGVYPLTLISIAFNDQRPKSIHAISGLDDKGIDRFTSVQFKFKDEGSGNLFCTIESDSPDECVIIGKNGYAKLHAPFWCSTRLSVKTAADAKEFHYDFPINDDERKKYEFENGALMQYEIAHACEMFRAGKKESDVYTLDHSLQFMEILDEIRDQIGLDYGKKEKAK